MPPIRRRHPGFMELEEPKETVADAVREFASERGVSERTVWRWLAAARAAGTQELPPKQRTCQRCGALLAPGATGRKEYCDDVCRVYAWRERNAAGT
jgi:hypothetical protein